MKPLNLDNRPCSPISSNCVIWQGPDIPCIKLCTGDTISDVIFKLATELCTIMDTLDIKNYDLSCFNLAACPPADFQALIQFLIEQICASQGIDTTRSSPVSTCPDCVVTVAPCFVVNGQTTMQLVEYVTAIGNRICNIIDQITLINIQLTSILIRVGVLEDALPPVTPTPTIIINCAIGSLSAGGSYAIDTVLDSLLNNTANGYCTLLDILGTPAEIGDALVPACAFGTDVTTDPNWTGTPTTLAESLTNAWIVLCDVYAAVSTGLINTTNTNSVSLDITAGILTANIQDTGWKDLEGFAFYQAGMATQKPQCRRIGNQILFRGVVYIPIDNGLGAPVLVTTTESYNSIYRVTPFVGLSGVVYDSDQRILFNSNGGGAASVIPTSVLDAGTNLDNAYAAPQLIATRNLTVEQQSGSGITGSVLLTAAINLVILPNKTLRITPLETLEQETTDMVPFIGSSLLRSLTSSFSPRSRVIDFANYVKNLDGNMSLDQAPLNGFSGGGLTIGQLYRITEYTVGDDFTNVGALVNANNQAFIATGLIPTTWTTTKLIPLSNALHYDGFYDDAPPLYTGAQWPAISDLLLSNFDAARNTDLGGFTVRLDGLSAYVDPCTTDIKNYTCP
jgi:hypothetical protein